MSDRWAVSVVLSTFNRADRVGPAISRLLEQSAAAPPYEILVVDNNSTDRTQAVVQQHIREGPRPVRYVFEPRQGLSYARNAGVAAAAAPLLAFTDDDVLVGDEWVRVVKETFDAFPDVDCLGGRTLPIWPSAPPRWLTPLHWVGPLALQDYGDAPFPIDAQRPLCLAGANFAFRRTLFSRIGLFSPAFPRGQDTQLIVRMLMAGGRAMYVPGMLVRAPVAPERLTKTYHRRWHRNVGQCNARMGLEELSDSVLGLRPFAPDVLRASGIPLFAVRQLGSEVALWLRDTLARRPPEAFLHETRVHQLIGYVRESHALRGRGPAAALGATSGPSFTDTPSGVPAKLET